MNIVQAHIGIESLLDRFSLPLVSRGMLDTYLKTALFQAVADSLGDQKEGALLARPELTLWIKQQLKEYVLPKSVVIVPASGLYLSSVITHSFRYVYDVRVTVNNTTLVQCIPVDFSEMQDMCDDPFDKPTMTYPVRIYCALVGKTIWILKPTDAMVTGISYNCLVNPEVSSGEEVLSSENGVSAATAIIYSLTATYNTVVYEKGTVIAAFNSNLLTAGSVVKNYGELIIPEHLQTKVIAESAMLIDNFFKKVK